MDKEEAIARSLYLNFFEEVQKENKELKKENEELKRNQLKEWEAKVLSNNTRRNKLRKCINCNTLVITREKVEYQNQCRQCGVFVHERCIQSDSGPHGQNRLRDVRKVHDHHYTFFCNIWCYEAYCREVDNKKEE